VIGASESAILIALALSFAFGGEVVDAIGPRGAYAVGGLSCLAAALVLVGPLRKEHLVTPLLPSPDAAEVPATE
jgi:predicted MFS family arabinose efflux permease